MSAIKSIFRYKHVVGSPLWRRNYAVYLGATCIGYVYKASYAWGHSHRKRLIYKTREEAAVALWQENNEAADTAIPALDR